MGRLLSLVNNTAMADQQCELDVQSVVCDDWRRTTTVAGIVCRVVAKLTSQIPVGPRQKARRSHARRPLPGRRSWWPPRREGRLGPSCAIDSIESSVNGIGDILWLVTEVNGLPREIVTVDGRRRSTC